MTRNGLPLLVAIFTVLALSVRPDNTLLDVLNVPGAPAVLAQDEPIPLRSGLFYDPYGENIYQGIGSRVTITVQPDGTTTITAPDEVLGAPNTALGDLTNDLSTGTVFFNTGTSTSYINAGSGGAVISTTTGSPAIQNGNNTTSETARRRIPMMRVGRTDTGTYYVEYGFYLEGDLTREFNYLDWDEIPENVQEATYTDGTDLWMDGANAAADSRAYLKSGHYLDGYRELLPGTVLPIPAGNALELEIYTNYDTTTGLATRVDGIPIDMEVLDMDEEVTGMETDGHLVINERRTNYPNFRGKDRTLIESAGQVVIANYGTLVVNDAQIQNSSSSIYGGYYGTVGILNNQPDYTYLSGSYGLATGSLTINNTQIGSPVGTGGYTYQTDSEGYIMYDEDGYPILIPIASGGIAVNENGTPVRTDTHIGKGEAITMSGANGRILAGHDVQLSRNTVGEIAYNHGSDPSASHQTIIDNIDRINGPTIGILSRSQASFTHITDDEDDIDIINARMRNVYSGGFTMPTIWTDIDRAGGYWGGGNVSDTIQVNENSWIFANTGISFGNSGSPTMSGGNAVRLSIDNTSGIYAGGYGNYYSGSFGLEGEGTSNSLLGFDVNVPWQGAGLTSPVGITDRYSLVQLFALGGDEVYSNYMPYYSGSYHEILVDGKVIAGAPSVAGIQLRFQDTSDMSPRDKEKLKNIYYHDPTDPDADIWGNVYYSDTTADRFIAYNNQPNRVFYFKTEERDAIPLTYYDEATQRWTVHPNASQVLINTGYYHSTTPQDYFEPLDNSSGLGIEVLGTSLAYEGTVFADGFSTWSTYYGPTVREITALGNDSLIAGGSYYGGYSTTLSGPRSTAHVDGAAMQFGPIAHVGRVLIGENKDVKNLSDVLFDSNDTEQSVKNFQAFDMMTSIKRSHLLYDPTLLYDNDGTKYHFDNAGVHGDIISWYNAVVDVWFADITDETGTGGGEGGEDGGGGAGTGTDVIVSDSGSWIDGIWAGATYSHFVDNLGAFWQHYHGDGNVMITYEEEVLGITTSDGPSYLLGHRDMIAEGYEEEDYWTADNINGRTLVLDELLLYNLAGRVPLLSFLPGPVASTNDSFGYADNARHFREALAWFTYGHGREIVAGYAGLTATELLEGYTRDGTLLTFSNGDIFSGNIFGSGVGDRLNDDIYYFQNLETGASQEHTSTLFSGFGNIDLRFTNGTTIFNRNVLELVEGDDVLRYAGIRVRDVYVEKTGHLMLNDAEFAVNPFHPIADFTGSGAGFIGDVSYDDRLIIHDVLNEGIVSGNGVFQIAQRFNYDYGVDYFEGYFINRGILAPGLNGFIGENEYDAMQLEQAAYDNMLDNVTNTSGDGLWEQLMRAVPGGQFGTMTVFGSLRLMDEHKRPNYNPESSRYNVDETLDAGEYHVTIGNDSVKDMFGKYVTAIKDARSTYIYNADSETYAYDTELQAELAANGELSQEDWKIMAVEKLGTHLSWFSTAAMVDKQTGLQLMTQYEQFEYLTNPERRKELQRKMLETVLTAEELRLYDADPAQRAALTQRMFKENNIQFELTEMDNLLWRYGFSDVVSVHGTIPSYWYNRIGWENNLTTQNILSSNFYKNPDNAKSQLIGVTQLGGVIQADRIYDTDENAAEKEKQTSFIIIASEGYTFDGSVKTITSDTSDWVYASVDLMPGKLATGQTGAVLTVVDDPNYYRNRVSSVNDSFNAQSVAGALDDAMLTNPGLALSFQFGLNSSEVLNDTFRQVASGTRSNSVVMNLWSPSDQLFNQIGYGHGGLSTGRRGNVVFQNMQNGQMVQPYGQPAVPPPGTQYAPPMGGQYRGQSPKYRTGSIWGAYTNTTFTMGDDGNSFEYNFYRNGAMIGSEWNLTPSSVLGGVASLSHGTFESLSDEVKSTDYSFGLYLVAAPFEQFEVKSYLGGGYQSYKTDRYIRNGEVFIGGNKNNASSIFGLDEHYDSETQGYSFNYAIEFARPFTVNPNFVIRPAAGFEYQNIRQNGYSEQMHEGSLPTWSNNGTNMAEFNQTTGAKSGTYGMHYNKMDFSRSLVRFGVNTESYFARGGWQFRGYYIHKLTGDRYPVSSQSFTSGSSTFNVRGAELGNSYVQVGLGSFLWLNRDRTATWFANGDWNFSLINNGYSMLSVNTGLQLSF